MKAEDIKNSDMLFEISVSGQEVEINSEEVRKAQWVDVNEELPTEEGLYFVLTDEGWMQGVAYYSKNKETKIPEFEVLWAAVGQNPKVAFWLKDNMYGLIYEQRKKNGEI